MALNSHQRGPAIVVVGAQGCGKTSLVSRFTDRVYNENCLATVGIDVLFLGEQAGGLKPSLWDASGHPRFAHIVRGYLGGARAALLVYDVTNRASLEVGAVNWLAALREEAPADLTVILVGAKADCPTEARGVTTQEAVAFVERHGLQGCLETSAKTGAGVETAFEELFELLRGGGGGDSAQQQEEPLILTPRQGGKPGQWNIGACFSAIGQLLCRRAGQLR